MSELKIDKVSVIDLDTIQRVFQSKSISATQKEQFINNNKSQIQTLLDNTITAKEFSILMANRPLQKFKPLKNSFTKRGDKILLAKSLNIPVSQVDNYIRKVAEDMKKVNGLNFLPIETFELIKNYVYRHGSVSTLTSFLNYELTYSKNVIDTLYCNLEYYSGGIADYFIRPIHRMSNKTMLNLYEVINENIYIACENGDITEKQKLDLSKYALIKLYKIKNNSKFINAVKTYNVLN